MKKFTLLFIFFVSSSTIFAEEIPAKTPQDSGQEKSNERGYHEHDGVYLRYVDNFGFGYVYHNLTVDNKSKGISDWGGDSFIQLGYAIDDNFILYGQFRTQMIPPLFTISIVNWWNYAFLGTFLSIPDYSALALTYSVGLTRYFMPQNIYVSTSLGFKQMGVRYGNIFSEASGLGLQASVGKEWWVSKNWGLGLALNLSYDYFWATRSGYPTITPMHAFAIGLSFSATYN